MPPINLEPILVVLGLFLDFLTVNYCLGQRTVPRVILSFYHSNFIITCNFLDVNVFQGMEMRVRLFADGNLSKFFFAPLEKICYL